MPKYDRAACGLLTTRLDGRIIEVNQTMLDWLGASRDEVAGRAFIDLLTGGGRIYHETHYAPMVTMQGSAREIAFDLERADGSRLPVLVNARLDHAGGERVIQVAIFDATERRLYERELLAAKERAERSEAHAQLLARTLQETLLPDRVPTVPGLEIATVYLPAGLGHEIGGDFYDVFQIGRDDWVIAIGDVEGKGVGAAVVTALVRHTIRAASVENEPDGVLRVVNEIMRLDDSQHYCTALVLRCRRSAGGWAITLAAGGHPLPILATPSSVKPIGRPGTLLGMFESVQFTNVDVTLAEGDVLLAYTDGITEARCGSVQLGEDAVCDLIARNVQQPPQAVLDAIVDEAVRFGGSPNADDIAAIAIKRTPVWSRCDPSRDRAPLGG